MTRVRLPVVALSALFGCVLALDFATPRMVLDGMMFGLFLWIILEAT